MKALLAPLAELADYEEIRKNRTKENGMIQISGCVNTQKIHLLSGIGSGCGYLAPAPFTSHASVHSSEGLLAEGVRRAP